MIEERKIMLMYRPNDELGFSQINHVLQTISREYSNGGTVVMEVYFPEQETITMIRAPEGAFERIVEEVKWSLGEPVSVLTGPKGFEEVNNYLLRHYRE